MKKKYILPLVTSLLVLGSCDYVEDNFEGIEQFDHPTNVFSKVYTLTAEDYTSIADLRANKDLAEANGVEDQLSALKTSMAFTDELPASDYLPAFLMENWFSGDEGSAIRVTYNKRLPYTDTERAINAATMYMVSADDYLAAWEGIPNNFFTPSVSASRFMPQILVNARPEAQEGDMVLVDYAYSEAEPAGSTPAAVDEDFEGFWNETVYTAEIPGWQNVVTVGTYAWSGRIYSGNAYIQQSSYGHKAGVLESYMITPKIAVESGMSLTFDACYGNYREAGGRISLLYIETSQLPNFNKETVAAADWVDISDVVEIPVPSGTYGTLGNVCDYDLSSLAGKEIYIAFRYNGDNESATTTVQIDNVVVKGASSAASDIETDSMSDLFRFNGSQWQMYDEALSLDGVDYQAMGSNYGNLSNTMLPDNYLPAYLAQTYPYAQEEDAYTIAYKYYDGDNTTVQCSSYTYKSGKWQSAALTTVTEQFVMTGGEWCYNPSTTITLEVGKSIEQSSTFYQAITDWVKANHPEYVTGYGNNDYYYGGSAYQNNFDFRVSAWRGQGTYNDLSDEEITNLMWERLPEAFPHALEVLYADIAPVEGIEVIYTINFGIYDGVTTMWTIQYEVTGVGQFTYVEDSLKKME